MLNSSSSSSSIFPSVTMLGPSLRARLLCTSLRLRSGCKRYNKYKLVTGTKPANALPVMATRNYSGRPSQSSSRGGGRRYEYLPRRGPPSKSLLDQETDVENWFEKQGAADNNRNSYANTSSRGNTRGRRPGGNGGRGLLNKGSRDSPATRLLEISDDENEDEDGFEKRDFSNSSRRSDASERGGIKRRRTSGPVKKGSVASRGRRPMALSDNDEEEEEEEDEAEDYDVVLSGSEEDELNLENVFKHVQIKPGTAGTMMPKQGITERIMPKSSSANGTEESYLSQTRFDECKISQLSLRAIKDAGYERMTVVQEATLPSILKGKDVLAKAKTGTGKTVAFLLPSIEAILKSPPISRDETRPPIIVLIICPTRELACQAAAEANILLKYHANIGVQVLIGGTRMSAEQKRLQANPCQMLVATPGRLQDHIENTPGFARRLMGLKVLILDEADHLLDMGFRKAIERIIAATPKQRQTLLFSATVPEEVHQICFLALRRDHEFINTVEEGSEETHTKVSQMYIVASLESHFNIIYALLKEHISEEPEYKVLVFCTTAMVTRLVAELLSELKLNVREIHSRKTQSYRTRVSDEFRKSKGLILVTSDVSARGVDYPDVTLVIQVGIPSDREQYIHRLGRTGRKGKEGQGILLLAPWEGYFLKNVEDLPITKAQVPTIDSEMNMKVKQALSHVELKDKESAYQAWLGYYNSVKEIGRDKTRVVELANEFSGTMGLDRPPALNKLTISKMGLKNVPGLRSK